MKLQSTLRSFILGMIEPSVRAIGEALRNYHARLTGIETRMNVLYDAGTLSSATWSPDLRNGFGQRASVTVSSLTLNKMLTDSGVTSGDLDVYLTAVGTSTVLWPGADVEYIPSGGLVILTGDTYLLKLKLVDDKMTLITQLQPSGVAYPS